MRRITPLSSLVFGIGRIQRWIGAVATITNHHMGGSSSVM